MKQKRINILGVKFDVITMKEALILLNDVCENGPKQYWATPNPEICLEAQKDEKFRNILNKANIAIADGFGIIWASRYLQSKASLINWFWSLVSPWKTKKKSPFPERVTGTDLMNQFCHNYKERKIFLLGASQEVNQKLTKKLKSEGVKVVGNYSGNASEKLEPIIVSMINASGAEIVFVAFGAPKQEKWIVRNLPHMKSVKVAIGIGGAFDFLTGKRSRAPRWMRSIGLEWLYRLIIEPKRLKRIFRATIVFPIRILKSSYKDSSTD